MNAFARAASAASGGREGKEAAPGADRVGRGVQPPQAEGRAEQDAAVRVGAIAYRTLTGHEPSRAMLPWLGAAAHYGFSVSMGVCYALMAERLPAIRAGFGTLYGSLVWAVADEGITPALDLSRGPRELSPGVLAYGLVGHCVYGAALESVTRLASRAPARGARPIVVC